MNVLYFIIKVNILVLIEWSNRSPSIMLTIEPRIINIFWTYSPLQSIKKHMSILCLFLNPRLTTYHSTIGVQIIVPLKLARHVYVNRGIGIGGSTGYQLSVMTLPIRRDSQSASHGRESFQISSLVRFFASRRHAAGDHQIALCLCWILPRFANLSIDLQLAVPVPALICIRITLLHIDLICTLARCAGEFFLNWIDCADS
jgi:hypothetical protein